MAALSDTSGLQWSSFGDDNNHMGFLLVTFLIEWILFGVLSWYLEQVKTPVIDHGLNMLLFSSYEVYQNNP